MTALVGFVFLVALGVAVVGLVRGKVGWARIASRKAAGVWLAASLAGVSVAGALTPEPAKHHVATKGSDATTSTTAEPSTTTTTVDLTTTTSTTATTVAPASTSTTATTAAPSTTTSVRATTTTTARLVTTTTAAAAPATCSASASPPNPTTNTHEQVSVTSNLPNSSIDVRVHYKTTTSSYTGGTDSSGAGVVSFSISHATSGYRVVVDVTVGGRASCSTSFTPA